VSTVPERAVALARSVIGAPYLGDGETWGGKGYDWLAKVFAGSSVPPGVTSGYNFYNNALSEIEFGKGLDCSGLIFWSYNKAFGAAQYQTRLNPIYYENAGPQCSDENSRRVISDPLPGDLLCFDRNGDGAVDHVALYAGGDERIGISNPAG
jgi:calcium-activated chloride channel regulator 4